MSLRILAALIISSSMPLACLGADSGEREPLMTGYRDALLSQLDKLEGSLAEMTQSAEVVAERLLAGGTLYVAGQEAFVSESHKRAGGMMMALAYNDKTRAPYKEKIPLAANDVVLVGADGGVMTRNGPTGDEVDLCLKSRIGASSANEIYR